MKMSAHSLILFGMLATGALMLGACGKHDASSEAPPAASSTAAPAAPIAPAASGTAVTPPASSMSAPMPASSSMPAPASTAASIQPAANAPFSVDKVVVGDAVDAAHMVNAAKNSIAASENAIYASVETSGKTAGATLSARWSYLEGKDPQLISAISQSIATEGPAVTTFKIRNPHNWPEGKYKVDISLDGKPVSTQSFEVKAPS